MSFTGQLDELVDPTRNTTKPLDFSAIRPSNMPTHTLGLLHSTLLPSFAFQTALSAGTYAIARSTCRVDFKDILWASGLTANAWYHALAPRLSTHHNLSSALSSLSYPQRLLLAGVTLWGSRLFYRITTRAWVRGKDDSRYQDLDQDDSFWNKAFFSVFLPEAVFQSLISLGYAVALRLPADQTSMGAPSDVRSYWHALAVGLFGFGVGMEVLADYQLEYREDNEHLRRDGVWSIVRHPNYLGDFLTHLSFPFLAYASGLFHPLQLVGPLSNLVFLRFVGGDKENEASQEQRYKTKNTIKYAQLQQWKAEKNSFWPSSKEIANPWTWALVGVGAVTVFAERLVKNQMLIT
ncbi:hypothetical protein MBLNU457_4155t1 [Dothideomycetes sp. NU457]